MANPKLPPGMPTAREFMVANHMILCAETLIERRDRPWAAHVAELEAKLAEARALASDAYAALDPVFNREEMDKLAAFLAKETP